MVGRCTGGEFEASRLFGLELDQVPGVCIDIT